MFSNMESEYKNKYLLKVPNIFKTKLSGFIHFVIIMIQVDTSSKKRKHEEITNDSYSIENEIIPLAFDEKVHIDYQKYFKQIKGSIISEFDKMLSCLENVEEDDEKRYWLYNNIAKLCFRKAHNADNKYKDKLILSKLSKYGVAIVDREVDEQYIEKFSHVIYKIKVFGNGLSYNSVDVKLDHFDDIRFGSSKYHTNDIVEYLSYLFYFGSTINDHFLENVNEDEIEIESVNNDGLASYKIPSFTYIRFEPTDKQDLDSNSNCLIYYDKKVYHVNKGNYYSFQFRGNSYIDEPFINNVPYKWVIKKDDTWEEIEDKYLDKHDYYLMHGFVVFCKYENTLKNAKFDTRPLVFKDFNSK